MSKTPRTDALYAGMPSTCDTPSDAHMCQKLGALARSLERELAAVRERAEKAEAAAERLLEDAERYRWLFPGGSEESVTANINRVWRMWDGHSETWDAAIDAARRKG